MRDNKALDAEPPIASFVNSTLIGGGPVYPNVLAYAATGSHRARAPSAIGDGARARNRTLREHGMNATSVTAHKPPFPNSRIMLLISISQSITKYPSEQRVDQDGMIQLRDRSSTSTKNSQNKTMHRSCRSAALNFRNHFGGHTVMVAVMCQCSILRDVCR